MNAETVTFADIFIVINRVFTATFTLMNIHSQIYWCNSFTDILNTVIFAGKKINVVPNFTMNFMRFNVYGRKEFFRLCLILLLKNVIDPDSSNNLNGICDPVYYH